jgi:formate dehydrogenase major subunit
MKLVQFNGNKVKTSSRRGELMIDAKVTQSVLPGVMFVPFRFPDSRVNALTISALDPSAKCVETKVCAVKMEAKR